MLWTSRIQTKPILVFWVFESRMIKSRHIDIFQNKDVWKVKAIPMSPNHHASPKLQAPFVCCEFSESMLVTVFSLENSWETCLGIVK